MQSRLGNLEATRDRIREFLAQAESIEESLQINEELTVIEEEMEQVEGRMNYLFDRAAYSTITVQIKPELPPIVPTPTPTPTLTPTPTPTPMPTPTPIPPWTPKKTIDQAGHTLDSILRVLTEMALWFIIVVVPLVGPPLLIAWGIYRWNKRRGKQ